LLNEIYQGVCISLKANQKRYKYIQYHLDKLHLSKYFSKIETLENSTCFSLFDTKVVDKYVGANKHLHIIKDDVILHNDTKNILQDLFCKHKFVDFDIILTGIGSWDISKALYKDYLACKNNTYRLFKLDSKINYADVHSCIINKNSIKKLENILDNTSRHTDLILRYLLEEKTIKIFCMLPMVSTPNYVFQPNNLTASEVFIDSNICYKEQFEYIYKLFYKGKSLIKIYQNTIFFLQQRGYVLENIKENPTFEGLITLLKKTQLAIEKEDRLVSICKNPQIEYMQESALNSTDEVLMQSFKASQELQIDKKYKQSNDIAIKLQSGKEPALCNLIAFNYLNLEQKDMALKYFQKSLSINKNQAIILSKVAYLKVQNRDFKEAVEIYNYLLSITIDINSYKRYLHNIATSCATAGEYKKATKAFLQVLEIEPNNIKAHFYLSFIYLILQDYKNGFKEYEYRLKIDKYKPYSLNNIPMYKKGDSLDSKVLIVLAEQGLGDCIQYARLIPLILSKTNVSKVVFVVYSSLFKIFGCLKNNRCEVVKADNKELKSLNAKNTTQIPLGSIMHRMCFSINDIKATPYLKTTNNVLLNLNKNKLNIGLAWRGSSMHSNNLFRSVKLDKLDSLLSMQNVNFYSLHVDDVNDDIKKYKYEDKVTDLSSKINSIDDTASIVKQLDLVISVDTMVAHMSGALGVKVFLLLHYVPDYRWLLYREDSLWYESIRIFRQEKIDDYSMPIENIKNEVLKMI